MSFPSRGHFAIQGTVLPLGGRVAEASGGLEPSDAAQPCLLTPHSAQDAAGSEKDPALKVTHVVLRNPDLDMACPSPTPAVD